MEVIDRPNGLLGVELRHLVALQAVVSEGSFAEAARRLGYTQSALSQQIATLERAVGARLLDRCSGRRPLGTTEAGELLLRHAERVVATLRAAEADLAALAEGVAGSLRVGTFQTVGMTVLPLVLARFGTRWPGVDVSLVELSEMSELLEGVESGQLDLTFSVLPVDGEPFASEELMLDPYVLVVPAHSPLAERTGRVTRRDLRSLPLVGYRSSRYPHDAETHLRALGIAPRIVVRSDETATVHGLVASGVATAVLPRLAVNLGDERVRALDLGALLAPRMIGLTWHVDRYRSAAALAFQDLAREVCRELARGFD